MPTNNKLANNADLRFALVFCAGFVVAHIVLSFYGPSEIEIEQAQYCNNVRNGVWPDYAKGRYKAECGGEEAPKFDALFTN